MRCFCFTWGSAPNPAPRRGGRGNSATVPLRERVFRVTSSRDFRGIALPCSRATVFHGSLDFVPAPYALTESIL